MTTVRKFLMIVYCCAFAIIGKSQNLQHGTETSSKLEQLPDLKDWFLSTGNWEKDPQLYVLEFGKGSDTIIMLHGGWGGEHSGLINAVRDLKDQYHFIFYDQRGGLRSPFPDSLVTFNNHIEDIELLRKELKLDKLTIVGHSMGAVLASAYASKYPQRIKQLILLAPARLKYPVPEEDKGLLQQGAMASEAFIGRAELNHELNKYNLNRKNPALSSREETIRYRINLARRMVYDITKWSLLTDGKGIFKSHLFPLVESTYPPSGWDFLQEFKKRLYPVSIIIGDHDFLDFKNPLIKKWVSEVPRIKLSVIENAGHMIWLDRPKEFTKQLIRQLKG